MGHGRGKANNGCVDGWTGGDWGSVLLGILWGTLQNSARDFPTKKWESWGYSSTDCCPYLVEKYSLGVDYIPWAWIEKASLGPKKALRQRSKKRQVSVTGAIRVYANCPPGLQIYMEMSWEDRGQGSYRICCRPLIFQNSILWPMFSTCSPNNCYIITWISQFL